MLAMAYILFADVNKRTGSVTIGDINCPMKTDVVNPPTMRPRIESGESVTTQIFEFGIRTPIPIPPMRSPKTIRLYELTIKIIEKPIARKRKEKK